MAFQRKVRVSKFQWVNTTIWLFMTSSTIPLKLMVLDHTRISLPLPLMIFIVPKNSNRTLIHFQLHFILPLENMLVCWPPLPIPHNFLSFILIILTLNIPSWVKNLSISVWKEDTAPSSTMGIYATIKRG